MDITAGSANILLGRFGSQSSGLEREINSISVPFRTSSMTVRLRKPPTTMTGQLTAFAISDAAGTKYPSFTSALMPLTDVPFPLTSMELMPASSSILQMQMHSFSSIPPYVKSLQLICFGTGSSRERS